MFHNFFMKVENWRNKNSKMCHDLIRSMFILITGLAHKLIDMMWQCWNWTGPYNMHPISFQFVYPIKTNSFQRVQKPWFQVSLFFYYYFYLIVLTKHYNLLGWGARDPNSDKRPKYLQAVDVKVIETKRCEDWHRDNKIQVCSVIYLNFFEKSYP